MRILLQLLVGVGIMAAHLPAAVTFDVSTVGTTGSGETLYRYNYSLAGLALQRNMELEIRYNAAVYETLLNPVVPAGFDALVFQPDNPPSVAGTFSIFALIDNPPLNGQFSVDFTLQDSATPGGQQYFLNLFEDDGTFLETIGSGRTTATGAVPEPATVGLVSAAFLAASLRYARRRRS